MDIAVDVTGIARDAEQKFRLVRFGLLLDVADQSRCRANGDDQHTGRERIERSGMARLELSLESRDSVDDVAAGQACRLVDVQKAVHESGSTPAVREMRRRSREFVRGSSGGDA